MAILKYNIPFVSLNIFLVVFTILVSGAPVWRYGMLWTVVNGVR
jgi:hypothetical protein